MTEEIKLTASDGATEAKAGQDGLRLVVDAGTTVTFTAVLEGFDPAPASLELHLGGAKVKTFAGKPPRLTVTHLVEAGAEFTARAPGSVTKSNPVTVSFRPKLAGGGDGPPGGGSGNTDSTVVEAAPGHFDPTFAAVTGSAAVVVGGAIVVTTIGALTKISLPRPVSTLMTGQVQAGTFGERIAAGLTVASLGVGALLLAVGGWLGALETRGRLTVKVTKTAPDARERAGVASAAIGGDIVKGMEKLTRMRAVVAVLACGTLLIFASLAMAWDLAGAGAPASTTGASTTTGGATPTSAPGPTSTSTSTAPRSTTTASPSSSAP